MANFNWNIKAECEEGKKYEFEISADGKFKFTDNIAVQLRKTFTENELKILRDMAGHMDSFKYVKMECTRL